MNVRWLQIKAKYGPIGLNNLSVVYLHIQLILTLAFIWSLLRPVLVFQLLNVCLPFGAEQMVLFC